MIYILGTGYVAQAYAKYFLINSIPHKLVSRSDVLYTNPINLGTFLAAAKPELLINAAGYTGKPNVDACEDHKLSCLYGNSILPGFIGDLCQSLNIPWIHVSSGCIYNGCESVKTIEHKDSPPTLDYQGFKETDIPNFTFREKSSFYSGTKAMGEELLQKFSNVYICRLRIPFNEIDSSRNYLTKLSTYDRLINVANSITQIDEFIAATYALYTTKSPFGIYNVTNPGIAQANLIIEKLIKAGIRKSQPIWINKYVFGCITKTPRSNCLLDSRKICSIYPLTEVNEAIDKAIDSWIPSIK